MTLYLDSSVAVSLFLNEERAAKVEAVLYEATQTAWFSDLTKGETSAAISTAVRAHRLTEPQGRFALDSMDDWVAANAREINVASIDMRNATTFVRQFDLKLMFPDALHLALCRRAEAELVTSDERQAQAAAALRIPVTQV